jgi:hypothetical protein
LAAAISLVRPRGEALAKTDPALEHDQDGKPGTVSKRGGSRHLFGLTTDPKSP